MLKTPLLFPFRLYNLSAKQNQNCSFTHCLTPWSQPHSSLGRGPPHLVALSPAPPCCPQPSQFVNRPRSCGFCGLLFLLYILRKLLTWWLKVHVSLRDFCPRIKLFFMNISKGKIVFQTLLRAYILQVWTHKCVEHFWMTFAYVNCLFPRVGSSRV